MADLGNGPGGNTGGKVLEVGDLLSEKVGGVGVGRLSSRSD